MKSNKKKFIIGFLLISLIGVVLVAVGIFYYMKDESGYIKTQGYVVSVETRRGENGWEYRPSSLRYYVEEEDKYYETSVFSWFTYTIRQGDTMPVLYKKGNPTQTIVRNASKKTFAYAFMGVGGALVVVGIALAGKSLYDVKRKSKLSKESN